MHPVVKVENLSKTYITNKRQPGFKGLLKGVFNPERVRIEAVKDVNFTIFEGELVGFLGPNGAGKTTTLKMLCGILFPTAGSAEVLGFKPFDRNPQMQRQISLVMGNKMQLWWDLSAWDSFLVLKEIYEVPSDVFEERIEELISMLDIKEKVNLQVRRLSLGERMKCELAAALLHNPKVLFLDEPTLGLDVISQKRIREFLKDHNTKHGTTILLTSHYMADVAEVCKRVIVIDQGTLRFDGTLKNLMLSYGGSRVLRLVFSSPVSNDLSIYGRVISSSELDAVIEVSREESTQIAAKLLNDLPIDDLAIEEPDVEDVVREMFIRNQSKAVVS